MEPLQLPLDPAPSSLLLEGGKVSSRSSFELSSSGGIWLVRKGEKVRENERKCKRAGTTERFKPKNFIHQQKVVLQFVQMVYIMPKTSKITKIHELPLLHRG